MSVYIWHLSLQLTVHPTLPVLLTKTRPTEDHVSKYVFKKNEFKITRIFLPIQSLRIRWNRSSPKTSNHSLYLTRLHYNLRYPERNFGGNQLPDCSMGLSPLYPTLTSDLHVSTVGDLPPEFPLASINSGIIHNLSGPRIWTTTRSKM